MDFDTALIYFFTLFVCIAVGRYYKKIDQNEIKKNYGAGIGFMVVCLVCRQYAFFSLLLIWGNIMILKCSDKRYVNELSISFTWLYLLYVVSNLKPGDFALYINQQLAIRLVGLASEINLIEFKRMNILGDPRHAAGIPGSVPSLCLTTEESSMLDISALDVCAYAYHYIGIHKGPYYNYKEYLYHFNSPFTKLGDFRLITTQKLKKTLCFVIVYALLRYKFTPEIFYDDRFYNEEEFNTELRFLYNIPLLIMFTLKHEIIVSLSTCVFTEAGFGVYPALCLAHPGHGPTANEHLLSESSDAVTRAGAYEYNFAILRCFDNRRLFFGPRMRDTLKSWDIATRYWFFTYVYSNLRSLRRKEVRSAAAFAAWAVWSGFSIPQAILVATMWVWVNLEHEYFELFNIHQSLTKPAWNVGFSIMRLLCLIYLTPCLIIYDTPTVFRFYNSMCWMFHITILGFIIFAIILFKVRMG